MDSFQLHTIKLAKVNAISKNRKFRKIASYFRLMEACVVLVLLLRVSSIFPVALKNSGEYLRELSVFVVSPRFVFILGNLIVIILFAKSRRVSGPDSAARTDFYEEFVEKSEKSQGIDRYENENREIIQRISEEKAISIVDSYGYSKRKNLRRSKSDKFKHVNDGNFCRKLKRAETEKFQIKNSDSNDEIVSYSDRDVKDNDDDGMSNDEFRDKIESFIARQKMFRKDEEISIT